MYRMTDDEFEAAIEEALDLLPERFVAALDNIGVCMEDEPSEEQLAYGGWGTETEAGELLGLYEGLSITERGAGYGEFAMDLPDLITVFKGPHERSFDSRGEVVGEIRKTVIHEIGHYFGLDEEQLERMGY